MGSFSKNSYVLSIFIIIVLIIACNQKETHEPPNVLIILADDAGYADFGFMGSVDIETPNIDIIAENGVRFIDAHTTGSVCSPSRAGLITGRYQQRFGHENNSPPKGKGMDPSEATIADVLKANGYATGIFGKWHLGETEEFHPNNRGFNEFYGFLEGHRHYYNNNNDDQEGNPKANQHNGKLETFEGYYTDVLGEKTVDFILKNKDKPFFAFLSFNAVHTPMESTPEDLKRFNGHPRQKLAAMTWAMDRAVGNVINTLKKEKKLDNTIIFFLSDNGGPSSSNASSNLPLKGEKGYEYEGGHRIPLVIQYGNKIKKGLKFEGLTSTLDIFPTILTATDTKHTNGKPLDGVNLMPYLQGKKTDNPHKELYWRIEPWAAARVGDYKLINAKGVDNALYNLNNEIEEKVDIKNSDVEVYKKILQKLSEWEIELEDPDWKGDQSWLEFKKYRYQDLIDDIDPRFKNKLELRRYLDSLKEKK